MSARSDYHDYTLVPQDELDELSPGLGKARRTSFLRAGDVSRRDAANDWGGEDRGKHNCYDRGVRFDLSTEPWVIHPYHPWVQAWYKSLICFLIADVVYLPLETAFGRYMPQHVLFLIDLGCTVVFSADIILQFFLQIPSPMGFWVFNHWAIMRSYLSGNFAVDILSVMPFSEIHILLCMTPSLRFATTSGLLHVLRFTKLLRMLRLRRILHRDMYDMNLTYTQRSVIFCGCTVLVSIHIFSCVWATLGNYQGTSTWLSEHHANDVLRLGGTGYNIPSESVDSEDTIEVYIMSTYFAIYTLTGIGYGDIFPSSIMEYVIVIVIMILGSIIWATIIAEIVSVLRHVGADDEQFQRMTDEAVVMGKEFRLDPALQLRIHTYFQQSRAIHHANFAREKVLSLMSSNLAVELTGVLHSKWLDQIWWLRRVKHNNFIVQLTLAFRPMLYAPKELIKSTDRLHVIQRGLCIHGNQLLGKDKCFGVDMLLTKEELRVNLITLAFSYLHVIYLTRDALQETLERFPREQELVRRAYRILVLLRGMIYKANKIKASRGGLMRASSKKSGILTSLAMKSSECLTVTASHALETRASNKEIRSALDTAGRRLEALEGNMSERLTAVEGQIKDALDAVSDVVTMLRGRAVSRGTFPRAASTEAAASRAASQPGRACAKSSATSSREGGRTEGFKRRLA